MLSRPSAATIRSAMDGSDASAWSRMLPCGTCGEVNEPSGPISKCRSTNGPGSVSSGDSTSTASGGTSSHIRVYAPSAG